VGFVEAVEDWVNKQVAGSQGKRVCLKPGFDYLFIRLHQWQGNLVETVEGWVNNQVARSQGK